MSEPLAPGTVAWQPATQPAEPHPQSDAAATPRLIGRYEVQRILGKGGMGIAYLAWDPQLKRLVALKLLRGGTDATDSEQARFRGEAEAIARVQHAHIVQVFDVGSHDGQPFFAMEYCAGGSLAQRLNGQPLPPREAALVVQQIAHGIAAAHAQQIIHRDLKPANVLLFDKPPALGEGQPTVPESATVKQETSGTRPAQHYKVSDFGLAKHLDDDDGQTRTGAVMGTPSYMAPEQAFGAAKQVTPSVDVYALGAILYECLTGRPPFRGATTADTLDQVRYREPVPPRQLQPSVPVDLETIALKCLQKEAGKRYASATALADDLQRYREGRPIVARPLGMLRRSWRWCWRNPIVASLLLLVFVVLAGGAASTTLMWLDAEDERTKVEQQRLEAVDAGKRADQQKDLALKSAQALQAEILQHFSAVETFFLKISEDRLLQEPGMTELRRELLLQARPLLAGFVAKQPHDPAYRLHLSNALSHLARIEVAVGSSEKALALYREMSAVLEQIQGPPRLRREALFRQASSRIGAARALHALGRTQEALETLQTAHKTLAALANSHPTPAYRANANTCLTELAQLYAAKGEPAEAEKHYRQAVAAEEEAARGDDVKPARLGEVHFVLGQWLTPRDAKTARTELAMARAILSHWADRDEVDARMNLGKTLGALANLHAGLDQRPEAERVYREGHELWDRLVRDFPSMPSYRRDRAANAHNCWLQLQAWNRKADAEAWGRLALADREALHDRYPEVTHYQYDLAISYRQLAVAASSAKQPDQVVSWNGKALALTQQTLRLDPHHAGARELLAASAGGRASALLDQGKAATSLPDWSLALEHHRGERQKIYRAYRALALARTDDWQGAKQDIEALHAQQVRADLELFVLACASSRCLQALAARPPMGDTGALRAFFTRQAMTLLWELKRDGFLNEARQHELRTHADFAPLRQRPDFQALPAPK